MRTFNLSNAQLRILTTEIANPGTTAYIVPISVTFPPADESYILDALKSVLIGNINIRFTRNDNLDVVQYISEADYSAIKYVDVDIHNLETALKESVSEGFATIFDVPMYRFTLIKAPHELILVIVLHHLIGDGTSIYMLADRLQEAVRCLKNGGKYSFNEADYQLYIEREAQYLNSPEGKKDKAYWVNQFMDLSGFVQAIPVTEELSIGTKIIDLPEELIEGISAVCNKCNTQISPFVFASALAAVYLTRVNNAEGIVLSSGYSGRSFGEDLNDAMGMFVNLLPQKYPYSPEMTFVQVLENAKLTLKSGLTHGKYPFNLYTEELKQKNIDAGMLLNYSIVSNSWESDYIEPLELSHGEFPLLIRINPGRNDKDGLQRIRIEYRLDCFADEKIDSLADGLLTMLEDIVNNPATPCGKLNLVGEAERRLIADGMATVQNSFACQEAQKYFEKIFAGSEIDSNLILDKQGEKDVPVLASYTLNCNLPHNKIVWLGAFAYTLAKYTNQEEVIFCITVDGKILPLYMNINETQTALEYLQQIDDNFALTQKYSYYPFVEIKTNYAVNSDVILVCGESNVDEPFKLKLNVSEFGITGTYNANLYNRETIERFSKSMYAVMVALSEGQRPSEIEIISRNDMDLVKSFNDNTFPVDRELTIVDMLRSQAARTPNHTAVVYANNSYTYRELDQITDRIAGFLTAKGAGREQAVGILIHRSELMVICSIGVLKSGAAYLPLDPNYPPERLEFMLRDAGAKILIRDDDLYAKVPNYEGEIIPTSAIWDMEDCAVELVPPKAEDLFILLYTSGSTGTPKGCMIEHRNLVNFCLWYHNYYGVTSEDKSAAYASYGFDACMMDLYPFLTRGACVHIIPEEMRLDLAGLNDYFEKNGITMAFMTTQLGRQFAISMDNKSLRHLSVGGEKLVPCSPPDFNFHNLYGPTECTILSTAFLVDREYPTVPIGKPLGNTDLYILDKQGRQMPVGVPGELCISGYQVSRGYLGRDDLTADKYVSNPYNSAEGYERYYKTGDVCRWLPDGNIEFVGRRDFQVKIRGFRVELTEIESKIREYPGILDATVVAYDEAGGGKCVAAYIVADHQVKIQDLNDSIAEDLPYYMVPAVTMQLENIPLNQNGKVNKRALPEPKVTFEETVPPQNKMQAKIFNCIKSVIGNDAFGINTDIYRAGLTSIGAVKLNVILAQKFGINIKSRDIKQNNTVEKLEQFILHHSSAEKVHDRLSEYPLTQTQMGIYLECLLDEKSTIYNIPMLFKLGEGVDIHRLAVVISKAIDAHPYMKCYLKTDISGDIKQVRNDDFEYNVQIIKTTAFEEIKNTLVQPFDFASAPLFKFVIYQTDIAQYLFMDIHHIICDGSSLAVLFRDINRAYKGEALQVEDYSSFELAIDEMESRGGKEYTDAKAYFNSVFKGVEINSLPARDVNGDAKQCKTLDRIEILSMGQIDDFCKKNHLTPNAFFSGAFAYLLGQYTNQDEALFTTIYNGRNDARKASMIGMLVKTLPIYANLDARQTVAEYLKTMKEHIMELMAYDIYSFGEISRAYGIKADILFAWQGEDFSDFSIGGEPSEQVFFPATDAKAPLSVDVFVKGDKFRFVTEYRSDCYSENMISALTDAYIETIKSFLEAETLADVNIISEKSLALLDSFNQTDWPVRDIPVSRLFEEQAALYPNKVAVLTGNEQLTFKELNEKANRVANSLIEMGIHTDQMVGIMLTRTVNVYVACQGVLKSGGAFLPIDPEYPDDRIEYILEDSAAPYLITTEKIKNERSKICSQGYYRVITMEQLLEGENTSNPVADIKPHNMCYCIYTSGSTGKPKGVMIEHTNLAHYCSANPLNPEIMSYVQNAKASLALAAITFDVSILEQFVPLLNGITVCMANEEEIHNPLALSELIINKQVDMMTCTPSFITNIVDEPVMRQALRQIKAFNVGAESFPAALYEKIKALGTDAHVFNGYGPTEATIGCTFCEVMGDKITIGKPMSNVQIYMISKSHKILPAGVPGELVIAGRGVGRGYVNNPEMTADKYITLRGQRAYRSGDLAKWNFNGEIEFHGRIDNQVKLRGLRVELGEIEKVMNDFKEIISSVVVVHEHESGQFLCGYFTAQGVVDKAALSQHLSAALTYYMVPGVLIQLDKLPLTNNGKVDKKALPLPEFIRAERKYIAPANRTEADLCAIFESVLGLGQVGATDNFFEIGGASLSASKVAMKCMTSGYNIVYGDIFKSPTPRGLAAMTDDVGREEKKADIITSYNYQRLDAALARNDLRYIEQVQYNPVGNILLTGATGFLGIHVLKEFLDNYNGKAYCFIRKGRVKSLEERLKLLLMYYFEDTCEELFGDRIIVIDGDITDLDRVLALEQYDFDMVINCAANVKHFVVDDTLEKINVGGVNNLIKLCQKTAKRLIQVSTSSIAGEGSNNSPPMDKRIQENELYFGQGLENAYIHSKFLAERAVLEAIIEGLDAKIMRVGNLMPRHSDGEFQINFLTNNFMQQLRGYKIIGRFPITAMDVAVEFSPIDSTAAAILKLSGTNREFSVFHSYNNHVIYMSDMIYAMKQYGFKIDVVSEDEFQKSMLAAMEDENRNQAISGLIAYLSSDTDSKFYWIDSNNKFTTEILYRLDYKWPIISDEYMKQSIKALDGLNFFDL